MANNLSFISFNMHGFNQGVNVLTRLCSESDLNSDVILIQENWCSPQNMPKILNFSNRYIGFGISAMEKSLSQSVLRGRPFGGVCTLIKATFKNLIKFHMCSERLTVVLIDKYLCINTYLPKIKNDVDLCTVQAVFAEIESVVALFPDAVLIWGGDFNVTLGIVTRYSNLFEQFIAMYGLVPCNTLLHCDTNYTYCHDSLLHHSYIDYFLISQSLSENLLTFNILDLGDNLSDHLPINIVLKVDINCVHRLHVPVVEHSGSSNFNQMKLRWDHAYLGDYMELCGVLLQPLYSKICSVYNNWMNVDNSSSVTNVQGSMTEYYPCDDNMPSEPFNRPSSAKETFGYIPLNFDYNYSAHRGVFKSDIVNDNIDSMYRELVSVLNYAASRKIPAEKCNFHKYWWNQQLDELKQNSIDTHRAMGMGRCRQT